MTQATLHGSVCQPALALMALFCALLLAGCGGGSGNKGSSTPDPVDGIPVGGVPVDGFPDNPTVVGPAISGDFLPFEPGSRWIFHVNVNDTDTGSLSYQSRQQVESTASQADGSTLIEVSDINPETGEKIGPYHLRLSNDRLAQVSDDGTRTLDLLRLPLHMGDRYTQSDRHDEDTGQDVDGDGVNETVSTHTEVLVAGFESLQTAVGRFPRALKVITEESRTYRYSRNAGRAIVKRNTTDWYVDGIGNVRTSSSFSRTGWSRNVTHDLAAYRIGNRVGDITPPRVVSAVPAEGSVQGARPIIQAELSEAADIRTVEGAAQLLGPDGRPVAGKAVYAANKITFTPDAPLVSGGYTLTVAGTISDALGNQAGQNFERHFTADADAPSVTAVFPADGAAPQPIDSVIIVEFSEPISPASSAIRLFSGDNIYALGAEVAVKVESKGNRVLLTPYRPLERAKRYQIVVNKGIGDLQGNALAEQFISSFTTETGQFLPSQSRNTGASVNAAAIGDIDQDGRPDVAAVIGTGYTLDGSLYNKLFVYRQLADGTLDNGASYPVDVPPGCALGHIDIADIDNDAANEILINQGNCGMAIFERSANGGWGRRILLTMPNGHIWKAADMDHDGRIDLIGTDVGGGSISVWFQQASGGFTNQVLAPEMHVYRQLVTADINADGLEDILIFNKYGDASNKIGILQQLPGRTFQTRYLDAIEYNPSRGLHDIAVADLNGDRRPDIVFAYQDTSGIVGILAQKADGSFPAQPKILTTHQLPYGIAIADFDRDGRADIIIAHWGGEGLSFMRQDSHGNFPVQERYPPFNNMNFESNIPIVDDINNDGYPDLVIPIDIARIELIYNNAANVIPARSRSEAVRSRLKKKRPGYQPRYPLSATSGPLP